MAALISVPLDRRSSRAVRSQDLAITILGSYLRGAGEQVWSGGMVTLMREFGFSTEAVRAALSRLVSRGLIERHRTGRRVNYALSSRAHELLAEGDRRIFSFGRTVTAAEAWTFIWHAIPENRRVERSRLASHLRFLGFGSLEDATWIAASDREQEVRALVQRLGVDEFVTMSLPRMTRGEGAGVLVSEVWDLPDLRSRYETFLADFEKHWRSKSGKRLSERDAFVVRSRLMHSFRGFSLLDPELPERLAPIGELRGTAVEIFDDLYERLADPAAAHFAAVAKPVPAGDIEGRSE